LTHCAKSENERREQAPPALAAAPQAATAKRRTIWLPILAVVLALNAVVFGAILLIRDEPKPIKAPASSSAEPEVRSLRKESVVNIETEVAPETDASVAVTENSTTTPVPVAKPAPASPETIQEGLPNLGQLRAAGLVSVGNLHIDMHVYSGDAAKRFVFINMSKYREGDRLTEGPTLEEITPEGVIMVQQGNRFRLDRD